MRFMVLLKVEADGGPEPTEAVRAYDVELSRAGVADRAKLSARGARMTPEAPTDGQTVAGFWVFDVDSREDAAAWVRRCPAPRDGAAEIEIRLLIAPDDIGERPRPRDRRPVWERAMAF
jgi:hypothetical protein